MTSDLSLKAEHPEIPPFQENPFTFLAQAQSNLGNVFTLQEDEPVFSSYPDCPLSAAVFGADNFRKVLSDGDVFALPISAARRLSLPKRLINLNSGLQGMGGQRHVEHRRLLMNEMNERSLERCYDRVTSSLESFANQWRVGGTIELLSEMRRLTLEMSSRLLFGEGYAKSTQLVSTLLKYFYLRREVTSPFITANHTSMNELIELGTDLDSKLRNFIRECRHSAISDADGIFERLAKSRLETGKQLSEDELIGHINMICISCNEPTAVALTWIFLTLSQTTETRQALRCELKQISPLELTGHFKAIAQLPQLDYTIKECLRIFPPNAMMVRVAMQSVEIGGLPLPQFSEIVLCPFLAHRDGNIFSRPNEFLPSRWQASTPSPFEYLPFGGGAHGCVGHYLAMYLIKSALSFLMGRYDLVLKTDQQIDWRVHILLMPTTEPIMTLAEPDIPVHTPAGKLRGEVGQLISIALDN